MSSLAERSRRRGLGSVSSSSTPLSTRGCEFYAIFFCSSTLPPLTRSQGPAPLLELPFRRRRAQAPFGPAGTANLRLQLILGPLMGRIYNSNPRDVRDAARPRLGILKYARKKPKTYIFSCLTHVEYKRGITSTPSRNDRTSSIFHALFLSLALFLLSFSPILS